MSTQSGITASPDLLQSFKSLDSTLIITISDDSTQLVEDKSFSAPSSTDPDAVFSSLYSHFSAQYPSPGYAIFSRGHNDYVFVSFIPDLAPIRQKMLFASTKNTLIQQLGSGSFGKNYILAFSELDELSSSHYEHATLIKDDPSLLTESEKSLKEINSLQSLTLSQAAGNSFKKELPSMHGLSGGELFFKIDESLAQELGLGIESTVLVMNINSSEQLVLTSKKSGVQVSDLIEVILTAVGENSASPSYILYGYAPGKVAFIYLCPSGSKVRERMLYAANKQGLLSHLKGDYFTLGQIDQVLEVGDLDEIDTSKFSEEPATTVSTDKNGLRFSKPKGPRRR
ncbi:CIC11C00000003056 [Sungouiella intermedia]|uniref:CIC11C00000003056 n=1 Tax=Sungouiella intermedia TaxID=45354 RepID=A0A1L0D9X9_9ASCO|nr:CIC11C00000003056 [[Candida] intermedia]